MAIQGDATQNAVLGQAMIQRARAVVVTPNRDDTAVLVTLTARELSPDAHIVTGGRESENLHLLRQGGADEVIDSTAAVGRMLGLAIEAPGAVRVLDDLIDAGVGIELVEVEPETSNGSLRPPVGATLIAVIRGEARLAPDVAGELRDTDRLVVMRQSQEAT